MFQLKIDQRQLKSAIELTQKGLKRLETRLNYAVDSTAKEIIADTQSDMLIGTKTGRLYGTHRASAKGETPAVITKRLMNSFKIVREASGPGRVVHIVNMAPYADDLIAMSRVMVLKDSVTLADFKNKIRNIMKESLRFYKRKR